MENHKKEAGKRGAVPVALVTVSDSRTAATDENGRYLQDEIERAGHRVSGSLIVKDEADQIGKILEDLCSGEAAVIVFNGGTGIAPRDTTFDALEKKLHKILPGFGEIFRMLSYEQVGSAAMLSRAVAGVYMNKIVFSIPGSPKAVRLAWEKLIGPELQHLAWELTR